MSRFVRAILYFACFARTAQVATTQEANLPSTQPPKHVCAIWTGTRLMVVEAKPRR